MSLSLNIPFVPCQFKEMAMSHVTIKILFGPHVAVAKVHVALLNLKHGQFALSILGVNGHTRCTGRELHTGAAWDWY